MKFYEFIAVVSIASLAMPLYSQASEDLKFLEAEDFVIEVENKDNDLEDYDNNILNYISAELGPEAFQYVFYAEDYAGEDLGKVTVSREIVVGESTRKDLIDAYGEGVSIDFDYSTDLIYTSMQYNNDENVQYFANMNLVETIFYDYNNAGQIVFFISEDGTIPGVAYTNVMVYEPDSDTVKVVQEKLNAAGYDCGTPDGIYGNNTKDAITQFQHDNGLFENGKINDQVIKTLGTSSQKQEDSSGTYVDIDTFVERYNEAIDYYNKIADRDGYKKAIHITKEMATTEETFRPDWELELCLNPNDPVKEKIDSFNIFLEDTSNLDSNVATGEVMAMIYALDTTLTDKEEALTMWVELNMNSTLDKNGILYNNYSFDNLVMITAAYN